MSESSVIAHVVTGPDCRRPIRLPAGRTVVGRHRDCDLRLDDETIAAFHVLLHATVESGVLTIRSTALAARPSTRLDGRPLLVDVGGPTTTFALTPGEVRRLTIGASDIDLRHPNDDVADVRRSTSPAPKLAAHPDGSGRLVVRRRFVVAEAPPDPVVHVPDPPVAVGSPPATGLVAAGVGVVGALLVASLMGNAMFAMFAGVAAAASLATWATSWIPVIRSRRR